MANLIQAYEYYLLATFALGALQVRTYIAMMRFILSVPQRWPELYRVLKANVSVLFTWPIVIVGSFTTILWGVHVTLRRLAWPQADVGWADLAGDPAWLALTAFFGSAMIILDGWALLRVARFKPPRMQWLLSLTDLGLRSSKIGAPLRFLVGWHVRTKLIRRLPMLVQWTYRRTAEVSIRLLFGMTLWLGWLARSGRL